MIVTGIPHPTVDISDTLKAVTAIYHAYPFFNILCFLLASLVSAWILQTLSLEVKRQHPRQQVILLFMLGVVCEYIIQALLLSIYSFISNTLVVNHDEIVYLLFSALVWGIQYIVLAESRFPIWYPYYINWATAILLEIALMIPSIIHKPTGSFDFIFFSLQCLRIGNLTALPCLYLLPCSSRDRCDDDTERQSLLADQNTTNYRATAVAHNAADTERDDEEDDQSNKARIAARLADARSWWDYAKEFEIFLPYLWPDEKLLQFQVVLLGLYPFASNALNLLIPRQLGIVFDNLESGNETRIYSETIILGVLWLLNSDVGVKWLQSYLWKPVQLHGYKAINTAAHSHVMNLSLDFHEGKETQAIHHDMHQGQSITSLVDKVCFKLIPMLLDLCIVCGYLYQLFGAYMALNVAFTTLFYLYGTAKLVRRATSPRRDYNRYYRKEWSSGHSTIDCWQLASYYNNVTFEHDRYVSNVKMQLKYRRKHAFAMSLISAGQSIIIILGQIVGCFLAIYQVIHNIRSLGDLAILLSYWAQLHSQLSFFSDAYTSISAEMIDAERLLGILKTKPSIFDKDDVKDLELQMGEVKFNDVNFEYSPQNPALKEIVISAPGGSTVGIVGESGSGKSTMIKLLTRFYDVNNGSIEIDGQDIRDVTLESLRKHIGVVSQDPTLFNDSIMNNIRYARMTASDEEVYNACKLAAVHDKIMSFPNAYDTRVGSRGIKLSGGEKQRVAIARVILKASKIIVLDEATSSVDTITEQSIQVGLDAMSPGCTVFIIAHRLSTIRDADLIVVMDDGAVVEQGTHDYLLSAKGKYRELWDAQTREKGED